jgi:hypothetical protein
MFRNSVIHLGGGIAQADEAQRPGQTGNFVSCQPDPMNIIFRQAPRWTKLRTFLPAPGQELGLDCSQPCTWFPSHGRKLRTFSLSAIESNGFAITPAAPKEIR